MKINYLSQEIGTHHYKPSIYPFIIVQALSYKSNPLLFFICRSNTLQVHIPHHLLKRKSNFDIDLVQKSLDIVRSALWYHYMRHSEPSNLF